MSLSCLGCDWNHDSIDWKNERMKITVNAHISQEIILIPDKQDYHLSISYLFGQFHPTKNHDCYMTLMQTKYKVW